MENNYFFIGAILFLLLTLCFVIFLPEPKQAVKTEDGVGFIINYDIKGKNIDNLHCDDEWQNLSEAFREKTYECLINSIYVRDDYSLIVNCKCFQTEL